MASRRVVRQASVAFEMPPPRFGALPTHRTTAEHIAWLRAEYADYPQWLALFLQGGVEFGGIATAQGSLI